MIGSTTSLIRMIKEIRTEIKIKKILALVVFLTILTLSVVSLPIFNESLELRVGDFSVWTSQYALGVRNATPPGAFYTITPYDDILVFADGTEEKIGSSPDTQEATQTGIFSRLRQGLEQLRRDIYLRFFQQLHAYFANTESGHTISYMVQTLEHNLVINRTVTTNSDKPIIAVGKSLIFNRSDEVYIDGIRLEDAEGVRQEGRLLTHPGAQYVDLFNPQLNYKIRINTTPAQTIVIDPDFRVITIKTFFDEAKNHHIDTTQILEIIKNE